MHLFRNLGIAKLLAVTTDVKPRNMMFAKVENREEGLHLIGRECLYR